jgi:hypothetical protein
MISLKSWRPLRRTGWTGKSLLNNEDDNSVFVVMKHPVPRYKLKSKTTSRIHEGKYLMLIGLLMPMPPDLVHVRTLLLNANKSFLLENPWISIVLDRTISVLLSETPKRSSASSVDRWAIWQSTVQSRIFENSVRSLYTKSLNYIGALVPLNRYLQRLNRKMRSSILTTHMEPKWRMIPLKRLRIFN